MASEIKFEVTGGQVPLATYGSLWKLPRTIGDEPIQRSLIVAVGQPYRKQLPEGAYTYYFAFAGQGDDSAFELVITYATSGAVIQRLEVKTENHIPRFLSFEV